MKIQEYNYREHGFAGKLYDAENGGDKLLIVIQGLKGLRLPCRYAEFFAGKGYSTLAMAYYGVPGLPDKMRAIPLEIFDYAIARMRKYENGRFKHFGIYGNSKGGGIALLAASQCVFIDLCIAVSATAHIFQGTGGADESKCKSMVSFYKRDFPYIPNKGKMGAFIRRCRQEGNIRLLYLIEEWEKRGNADTVIPVEKIRGPILLMSATHDESVPGKQDAEVLVKRLKEKNFQYPYKHINFENGSHNLGYFPVNNWALPREKHFPEECRQAREEALEIILDTLERWSV